MWVDSTDVLNGIKMDKYLFQIKKAKQLDIKK